MGKETWKYIPGYDPQYRISNLGNILNLSGNLSKLSDNGSGYLKITLRKGSSKKSFKVHRLVMLAFVGESSLQVDHINGIKTDNRLCNLEYVTAKENSNRRVIRQFGINKKSNKIRLKEYLSAYNTPTLPSKG